MFNFFIHPYIVSFSALIRRVAHTDYSDRSNISDEDSQIRSSIGHQHTFFHVSCRMNMKADAEPQRQALRCVSKFNLVSIYNNLPTREPCPLESKSLPYVTNLFLTVFSFVHLIAPSSTFCLSSLFISYGKHPR